MADPIEDLDPRKAAILAAVVREYVRYAEPVGSKHIVEAYSLSVSAATVRNDMAALEEAGYLVQPHTSAGRVPTDKGYRFFVDALAAPRPLSEAEEAAVQGFLAQSADLEELLLRTTQVLSQLTRHASLVLAPALDRSRLRLLELVSLAPRTVLLLLIADTGRVEQRVLELAQPTTDDVVARARVVLNESAIGLRLAEVPAAAEGVAAAAPHDLRDLLMRVVETLGSGLTRRDVDRLFVGGQASLAGAHAFEADDLQRVFEVLEEQVTLGRVLAETATLGRPLVRIGGENELEELRAASIVATGYGADAPGSVGVLGPTRMDYPTVLAVVRAVADQLQATLRAFTDRGDDVTR